nr:MAG TPA: hypothetical protein [Caudoviricetes sp.]
MYTVLQNYRCTFHFSSPFCVFIMHIYDYSVHFVQCQYIFLHIGKIVILCV